MPATKNVRPLRSSKRVRVRKSRVSKPRALRFPIKSISRHGTHLQWVNLKNSAQLHSLFDLYSKFPSKWDRFNRLPRIASIAQLQREKLSFFSITGSRNKLVGACGIRIDRERKRLLIARIFILPEFQGRGHGRNFMQALFELARKTGLHKAYGFVSAEQHPIPLRELRMMFALGCKTASKKPVRFSNGNFWLIEKDLQGNR